VILKKRIKILTLIVSLILLSAKSFDEPSLMAMLVGKVWEMGTPSSHDAYMSYTNIFNAATFTATLQVTGRQPGIDTYQYYLS
jgi:hypothetical protein